MKKKTPPPPKPQQIPLNIPTKPSMGASVGKSIMDGISLGTGSAIGRHLVDTIMIPKPKPIEPPEVKLDWCTLLKRSYDRCLKENADVDSCENMRIMIVNNQCV